MIFEITHDLDLVQSILAEPRCYRRMANDDAPPIEAAGEILAAAQDAGGVNFFVALDPDPVGIFILSYAPEDTFPPEAEVSACFIPRVWGRTVQIGSDFCKWLWSAGFSRLIVKIPTYNRLSLRLAKAVGFRECGEASTVVMRDGKEFDVLNLELKRSA